MTEAQERLPGVTAADKRILSASASASISLRTTID